MSRLALPEDVQLVFDPTMTDSALQNDAFYGTSDDADAVDSTIQNAESEFQQRVDDAYRLDAIRQPETHAVETGGHEAYREQFTQVRTDYTPRPVEIQLDHGRVLPIDSAQGDKVEIRKGMDDWEDVTTNTDDVYDLVDRGRGLLLVDVAKVMLDQGVRMRVSTDRRFVRVQYRFGAKGGDTRIGGETTLSASISKSDSAPITVGVADASRLPPAPAVLLLGGDEYVSVSDVDTSNDEITIDARQQRLTSAVAHSSGDSVHYAPLFVRTAIAKKTAIDLTQNDAYSEWLPDTDIPLDAPRKIDEWRSDWKGAIDLLS